MALAGPAPVRRPQHAYRAADYLMPLALAVMVVATALCLFVPGNGQISRFIAFFGGWVVGRLLALLYWSRYRLLGFIPYAFTAEAGIALFAGDPGNWPTWLVALFFGLWGMTGVAVRDNRVWSRDDIKWYYVSLAIALVFAVVLALAFRPNDPDVRAAFRWILVGLATLAAIQAWLTLLRPAIEVTAEPVLWLLARIRATGPGLDEFPRTGPVLVIANHAGWLDPLYLAKVLPRPVTPMMTARFYNLPVLRPILRHVIHVIVVPEIPVRRETPEVSEAIAALDAGDVVVIFPEGYLRRKEEQTLRRFGQGIWQILQARPETPVMACWIEGAWGSYMSYQNGPPMTNKKLDIRRPIDIGLSAPEIVPAEELTEHLRTRIYLMNRVLEARKHLGLPAAPPIELPTRDEPAEEHGPTE